MESQQSDRQFSCRQQICSVLFSMPVVPPPNPAGRIRYWRHPLFLREDWRRKKRKSQNFPILSRAPMMSLIKRTTDEKTGISAFTKFTKVMDDLMLRAHVMTCEP